MLILNCKPFKPPFPRGNKIIIFKKSYSDNDVNSMGLLDRVVKKKVVITPKI